MFPVSSVLFSMHLVFDLVPPHVHIVYLKILQRLIGFYLDSRMNDSEFEVFRTVRAEENSNIFTGNSVDILCQFVGLC